MDPTAQSAANPLFEDIEPFFEWQRDEDSDTLMVLLPGFRRDQLKVQVTSTPLLRISAERRITENRWRRVYKELSIPSDCDTNELSAKFEGGTLYIKFPKLISPAKPQETTPTKSPEREGVDKQNGGQEAQAEAKTDEVSEKSPPTQTEKEPSDDHAKEKGKDSGDDNKVTQKKLGTNGVETAEAMASKAHERQRAKTVTRSKTRALDFTLSSRPSSDQDYNEALAGLITGLKKTKTLMKLIIVIFLLLVLVLYVKTAFKSSLGGSKFQEL